MRRHHQVDNVGKEAKDGGCCGARLHWKRCPAAWCTTALGSRPICSPHLQQLLNLRLLRCLAGRVARRDGQVAERHTKALGHDLQVCAAGRMVTHE